MDYHIDNEIRLSENSENKSLYPWSLQEYNKNGSKIERDQIPWPWSLYFTASELRFHYSFDISNFKNNEVSTQENEFITAILHPSTCHDGESLEDDVSYSMFGTNRKINEFNLRIQRLKEDGESEICKVWGCVSYTSECDFRDITTGDCIDIILLLTPTRFNKIAELIKNQHIATLTLCLNEVYGFYSEWSPSISTNSIKVLTAQKEQVVVKNDDCKIDPLRLGNVNEFNLNITQRHKLNLKQDLRSIDIDKLFDDHDNTSEDLVDKEDNLYKQDERDTLLSQLTHSETALNQLRTPLWLIFIVLCIYVLYR